MTKRILEPRALHALPAQLESVTPGNDTGRPAPSRALPQPRAKGFAPYAAASRPKPPRFGNRQRNR